MVATRFAVAIHILLLLACRQRCGPATSHLIAASVNTNPVVVRRITGQLARAGLVRVRRGPGGAELTRAPELITLCDVWVAMNTVRPGGKPGSKPGSRLGTMLPLHAFPNQECAIGQQIHTVLGDAFAAVEDAMQAALQKTTLAGLAAGLTA
jgi:DNA-binding IscR family transcriptional regulator